MDVAGQANEVVIPFHQLGLVTWLYHAAGVTMLVPVVGAIGGIEPLDETTQISTRCLDKEVVVIGQEDTHGFRRRSVVARGRGLRE